ncbi:MAG: helix-turn-helix transcriptional regulator [Caldilineaceae bacterium]
MLPEGAAGAPYGREIGAMLRERREAMGVSLAEVEAATRIRQKYLSAIESDDWHLLPGEIVGRGFLRNYAAYLELEPEEVMERRRAITDPNIASTLINTSAGATLPPSRQVDYRPKDVDLHDDEELDEEEGGSGLPFLPILLIGVLLFFGWWNLDRIGSWASGAYAGIQSRLDEMTAAAPTPTIPTPNPEANVPLAPTATSAPPAGGDQQPVAAAPATDTPPPVAPTDTPTPPPIVLPTDTPTSPPIVLPTDTPTLPPLPTDTPIPPTPIPAPTDTPPPVVAAALCPDQRSAITSPGVNQVIAGVVQVNGTASHENFQYYKLEYLVGGAYNYFDGSNNPVVGGRLGVLDTTSLPNGAYTIRIVVVDNTGNFPPPCEVPVIIQN